MPEVQDMNRAYANSAFIPGSERLPEKWAAEAASFRASASATQDLAYGDGDRERLDIFRPEGEPRGLLVFIHGGYWMAFGRSDWSHLAAGAIARGWACAMPSYPLAPAATLPQITDCISSAIRVSAARVAGPVVVAGHSAGGHLSARMGNVGIAADLAARIRRVVPISPVAELSPLLETDMAGPLRLDAQTCAAESPARFALRPDCQAHVWVGGQERPAFLWQARVLSENWGCPWTVDQGRHHFDVIDALKKPDTPLMQALLGGL